jgi:hypothetical protein
MHSDSLKFPSCPIKSIAASLRLWGGADTGWNEEHIVWTACDISVSRPCVSSSCCCRRCFRDRPCSGVSGGCLRFFFSVSNSLTSSSTTCEYISGKASRQPLKQHTRSGDVTEANDPDDWVCSACSTDGSREVTAGDGSRAGATPAWNAPEPVAMIPSTRLFISS